MRWIVMYGAVTASAAACSESAPAAAPAVYDVRAAVVSMAGEGDDARVTLHHEAIPSFEDRSGSSAPMESMKMAFGIAPGVDRAPFGAGDKVSISFEVDWHREPALTITKVEPLAPDTALSLK